MSATDNSDRNKEAGQDAGGVPPRHGQIDRGVAVVGAPDAVGAMQTFLTFWRSRYEPNGDGKGFDGTLDAFPFAIDDPRNLSIHWYDGYYALKLPEHVVPPEAALPASKDLNGRWWMALSFPCTGLPGPGLDLFRFLLLERSDAVLVVWDVAAGLDPVRRMLDDAGKLILSSQLPVIVIGVRSRAVDDADATSTKKAVTADVGSAGENNPADPPRLERAREVAAVISPFCAAEGAGGPAHVLECSFETGDGLMEACDALRDVLVPAPKHGWSYRSLKASGLFRNSMGSHYTPIPTTTAASVSIFY